MSVRALFYLFGNCTKPGLLENNRIFASASTYNPLFAIWKDSFASYTHVIGKKETT